MPEDDPKAEQSQEKPARLLRAPNFRVAYSNTFRIRLGNQDVGIAFGYHTEIPNQTIVQDEVEVVLTPQVFKILSLALPEVLGNLEKVCGEIAVPSETLEMLKSASEEAAKETDAFKEQQEKSKKTHG